MADMADKKKTGPGGNQGNEDCEDCESGAHSPDLCPKRQGREAGIPEEVQ